MILYYYMDIIDIPKYTTRPSKSAVFKFSTWIG